MERAIQTLTAVQGSSIGEAVVFDQRGRPMIAGTRIPVYYIIQSLAFGEEGLEGFFRDYPWISREQVEAAIDWLLAYLGYPGDDINAIPLDWGR